MKSHGWMWMRVPVKTATVVDSNPDVKAHVHTYVNIVHTHTQSMLHPLDQTLIQMKENEMRWKSKDQIKPSMESVGQSGLSSISMTWSPAKSNPAKCHQAATTYTFLLIPPTSAAMIIYICPSRSCSQAHHSLQKSNQKLSLKPYFIFNCSTLNA